MRQIAVLFFVVLLGGVATAEPISGTVVDGKTLQPVAGAKVVIPATGQRVTTDAAGRYRVDVASESADLKDITLRIEAQGYELLEAPATEGGLRGRTIVVFPEGFLGETIEVSGKVKAAPEPSGQQQLSRREITRIPGTQGDAIKSVRSLPGVANADAPGSGPGLIVIRGAAPEDSIFTLDGVEIPLVYHFFGLQSILPSEFVETIDFQPGGFGAERGRATGGVISIKTRSAFIDKWSSFAELSFINFAGFVQGPLSKKHNLQLSAALRRSAVDLLLPAVLPDDANLNFTTAPQYYDGQLRVDWQPKPRHRVSALSLFSFDLLTLINDNVTANEPALTGKFDNETSFARLITTWAYETDNVQNRFVVSGGPTNFRFDVGPERFLDITSTRLGVRDDFAWLPSSRIGLRVGAEARYERNRLNIRFPLPPQEGEGGPGNFSTAPLIEIDDKVSAHVLGAYIAADFRPHASTLVTPGLRFDYYDRIGERTLHPRIAVQQKIGRKWTAKASIGAYSRPLDQAEALQTNLKPELATQYILGGEYRANDAVTVTASTFYTDRRQLIVQDPMLAESDPNNTYVNRGFGRSFGLEALVRIQRKRMFGWASYTVSRSDRIDGPLANRRLFDFDQTHNFLVVGSYRLGAWEFGGRWQYTTGLPTTPVVDALYLSDANVYVPVYGEVNRTRLNAAHQLDLRVDRRWKFRHWSLAAYLDITNVYANPKVLGFSYNFDYTERETIKEIPILPAIGVRGSF